MTARRLRLQRRRLDAAFIRLLAAGLTPREAAVWSLVGRWTSMDTVTLLALQWRDVGLDAGDCEAWNKRGLMSPQRALAWIQAGYTAAQFDFLQAHCEVDPSEASRQDEVPDGHNYIIDDWLDVPIPPDWVCRFVVAGMADPGEAWTIWTANSDRHALFDALGVLGGLRAEP